MIDHFFFYFALLIEKLKRISVKVAYSAALMFRNVNICGSEGVLVFIGVASHQLDLLFAHIYSALQEQKKRIDEKKKYKFFSS